MVSVSYCGAKCGEPRARSGGRFEVGAPRGQGLASAVTGTTLIDPYRPPPNERRSPAGRRAGRSLAQVHRRVQRFVGRCVPDNVINGDTFDFRYTYGAWYMPRVEQVLRVDGVELSVAGAAPVIARFAQILGALRVGPYIFTRRIVLSLAEPSHSHPVLTIHESHVSPAILPAVFVHEQMHWRFAGLAATSGDVVSRLRLEFPTSRDLVHIAVCRLEVKALSSVMGPTFVDDLVQRVNRYREEYRLAIHEGDRVDSCLRGPKSER